MVSGGGVKEAPARCYARRQAVRGAYEMPGRRHCCARRRGVRREARARRAQRGPDARAIRSARQQWRCSSAVMIRTCARKRYRDKCGRRGDAGARGERVIVSLARRQAAAAGRYAGALRSRRSAHIVRVRERQAAVCVLFGAERVRRCSARRAEVKK